MGNHVIHAGHAPCRHCGQAAARAPVQRLAAPRAFAPARREEEAEMPAAPFGHDFARVAVRPAGGADSGGAAA